MKVSLVSPQEATELNLTSLLNNKRLQTNKQTPWAKSTT